MKIEVFSGEESIVENTGLLLLNVEAAIERILGLQYNIPSKFIECDLSDEKNLSISIELTEQADEKTLRIIEKEVATRARLGLDKPSMKIEIVIRMIIGTERRILFLGKKELMYPDAEEWVSDEVSQRLDAVKKTDTTKPY